jgi:carboxyl-terminal processing protease
MQMNWKKSIFIAFLVSTFGLSAFQANRPGQEKESLILNAIMQFLEVYHFEPVSIDDNFSNEAFENYIESIDGRKRFLIKSEIDQLAKYKDDLDDQAKAENFDFFNESVTIIDNSRARAQRIYNEIMEEGIDIYSAGTIELDGDKLEFAKDEAALKNYWRKLLKYDLVNRFEDKVSAQEKRIKLEKEKADKKDKSPSYNEDLNIEIEAAENDNESKEVKKDPLKSEEELMADALKAMEKSYKNWFSTLDKDRRSDKFARYMNSMTHLFDPHSDYYSPKDKEDFDIRMGGKLEGIGARLSPQDEYTKVVSIVPGGPAWKGKELGVDDLITAVKQEDADPIDITGWRLDDVVQKIRGDKGTTVVLTVKKPDGSIVDIAIVRDVVNIDDAFARSVIMDIPNVAENVGYISLPKFYSSFEKEDGNSCAEDIKKEIEKLNKVNVNAMILDLRSNGGGSLKDVVDMSGLFIKDGPIVQVKPRAKDAYVYEDEDPQVHYSGPLVVMVNQFSASASEILAAALQDYNRAVIVGSNSTFGKGTVQRFVDLDRFYRDQENLNLGNLKITMQKFFRVDGGSTQLKGVTPDVILPNNYHYIKTGEKDYEHAMEWSEIKPVEYSQDVYQVTNKEALAKKSAQRIANNDDFNLILENARRLKENKDLTEYPIGYNEYVEYVESKEKEAEKFDDLFENKVEGLIVKNLEVDSTYINFDESRVERNKEWIEALEKDIYIEEVMHIINDMIDTHDKMAVVKEK